MKRIEREGPIALTYAVTAKTKKKAATTEETYRESEVIRLIALGLLNKQIGDTLQISIKTVEKHRQNAMQKLNLRNTADITRYAVAAGLIKIKLLFAPRIIKKTMKVRIAYTIKLTENDISAFEKLFKEKPAFKKVKKYFEDASIESTTRALEKIKSL
jgi:DNA-binding CsgD family transcriptional regulator